MPESVQIAIVVCATVLLLAVLNNMKKNKGDK